MSKIVDRYASAIRSGNLTSHPDTTYSDSDVMGAGGFAGKAWRTLPGNDGRDKVKGHPLAMALLRFFTGGDGEGRAVVEILTGMLIGKAFRTGVEISPDQARGIAREVLDWHRDSVCKTCGGHGYKVASGTIGTSRAVIGDAPCDVCRGSTRRAFDSMFHESMLELAQWLRTEVEHETSKAGTAAMVALAPKLEL